MAGVAGDGREVTENGRELYTADCSVKYVISTDQEIRTTKRLNNSTTQQLNKFSFLKR